jgi:glycosyltransferase involved in cell wall biosynthesis
MKVALVASSYLPRAGVLERHVHELAAGLTSRGAEVEVLTQNPPARQPRISEFDGFLVRRFPASVGYAHLGVAPGLWDHLRRRARSFDLVHVHTAHRALGLAVAQAHPRRFVLTLHEPVRRLLRWPYGAATQALIAHAARITCTSRVGAALLGARFPWAAERIETVPHGVDVAAIQAARPFSLPGNLVLGVGRLERHKRIDRAIAAMASLDSSYRLAIVGNGSARQRLMAHAADLGVSSRIQFVGSIPDSELYRWLRTACVLVALAEEQTSGLQLLEALAAGVPAVASDILAHHNAASYGEGAGVKFVPPTGSPLEVADAIYEATTLSPLPASRLRLPTWDAVVEKTLYLYEEVCRRDLGRPTHAPAAQRAADDAR